MIEQRHVDGVSFMPHTTEIIRARDLHAQFHNAARLHNLQDVERNYATQPGDVCYAGARVFKFNERCIRANMLIVCALTCQRVIDMRAMNGAMNNACPQTNKY